MKKNMLLAPNGKPSNLTAEQYKLVRTPAFKKWFGDWEKVEQLKIKDPAIDEITLQNFSKDVSKVVDENGEPKVMWHFAKRLQGKNERFNEFKTDRQLGAHFGSLNQVKNLKYLNLKSDLIHPNIENKDTDYRFYQVFLNIVNPTRLKDVGIFDGLTFLDTLGSEIVSSVYNGKYKNDITYKSKGSFLDKIKYVAKTTYGFDGAVYLNRYEATDDMKLVNKLDDASDNIFKSKVPNAEDSWIAFYPEQIKLADGSNTTFDGGNPDIRFENGGMTYRQYANTQFNEEEDKYLPSGYLGEFEIKKADREKYPILFKQKNGLEYRIKNDSNSSIVVFDGNKEIGYADNKAIMVAPSYHKKGIGLELVNILKERNPNHRFGSMTPEGFNLMGKYYDTYIANNPDIRFAKGGKIKTALKEVESAKSVKYWMQPEFPAESYDYPQKGKPNSFVKMYEEKYNADTLLAYDKKGNIVGLFTISKGGDEKGAFKIVVREDSENKGWGKVLLDEAEKQGIDVIGNIKHNSFSHSGRNLLRSWLNKKMEQGASKYEMGGIFHGTPHKFDKFTTDKMGTGEGGQAFGWGLYFTDVEKIGENYAKAISYSNSIAESIAQYVYGTGYTREQSDALMKMEVEEQIKIINDAYDKKVEKINLKEDGDFKNHLLETQNSLKERLIAEAKQVTPYLYEVTLFKGKTPKQYVLLDWYEPIEKNMSKKVVDQFVKEGLIDKADKDYSIQEYISPSGGVLYVKLSQELGGDKAASEFLLRAGIDGVKFPAESISKGLTKDNARGYNYVIFNANDVTIDEVTEFRKGGELAKGIKAEMEHKGTIDKFKRAGVSDKDVATSIAKDHLKEDPKYYTKLMKIEKKLALGGELLERKFDVGGNVNIQPIRQLGTGANVYFETPFYRLNDNTKDKYTLLVGLLNSGGYMYEYAYYYDNIEIPMFVVKELAKIYPNGVPDAVLIDKFVDTLEKKWEGNEIDSNEDTMEIEEKTHHGISTNVGDYKNPYEVNRAIEKLLNEKGSEQESYTPDEINFLNYYSGYGGLEKQGTFSDDELKGLLYEYFTPDEIVKKMWGLAYKYGYGSIGDNSVFEPSVGVGAFLKYAPDNVFVAANEINRYSAMICHILYPNVKTILMPFEKNFISSNMSVKKNFQNLKQYSLVIGNPPYGKLGGKFMPMGEDKYSGASNWAEYFLFRGLDLLQKGGLLIYIIGAEQYNGGSLFLDAALTTTKKAIFEKADLIDAYRLPNKIFERTGVSSEIVIFRKR